LQCNIFYIPFLLHSHCLKDPFLLSAASFCVLHAC
jgi:hypothetical protein